MTNRMQVDAGYPSGESIRQASSLSVYELFREQARRRPTKIAIETRHVERTYDDLLARVDRVAAVLKSHGVTYSDRIAILSENCSEYIEVHLAAAKIGAIVACQNWRLTQTELEHCINLVTPSLVICSDKYHRLAESIDSLARLPKLVFGDTYEKAIAGSDAIESPDYIDPESGLIILYTSGTTGPAKGALISHRAFISRMSLFSIDYGIDSEDGFLAWSPMFHMGGSEHSLSTLMLGGTVIVSNGFDIDYIVDVISRHRLSWLILVPGVVDQLIEALTQPAVTVKGVKLVGAMADLLPKKTIAKLTKLINAPFLNTFGATETGMAPASAGFIPVGVNPDSLSKRLNSLCSLRLVDDDLRDVQVGEVGEALVRGPTLFSGYWGSPEVNQRDFIDGWFKMGDVFRRNSDGTIDFAGRAKYLIKSGGENIYPAEIETVLLSDPRILDAVVVRKPDPKWGEVPVAVIAKAESDAAKKMRESDVLEMCMNKFASYKRPKEVRFVTFNDFPRSSSGKIIREEVERWLEDKP